MISFLVVNPASKVFYATADTKFPEALYSNMASVSFSISHCPTAEEQRFTPDSSHGKRQKSSTAIGNISFCCGFGGQPL
jgi:hypothetical protein